MLRLVFTAFLLVVLLTVLLSLGVLPPPVAALATYIVNSAWYFGIPLFFVLYFFAPGLFRRFNAELAEIRARMRHSRQEIANLESRIRNLDKSRHMVQLGAIYLQQGRVRKAVKLLQRGLEKDPDSLDAQYKLALCYFIQRKYAEAAELLEMVHAVRPEHDYGMVYLRLAQCHQKSGNDARAGEVYEMLLRFYPGHPEGTYHYALLSSARGDLSLASELMASVIASVRHSPGFHRRRNRHWMWKARWWLCCRGGGK